MRGESALDSNPGSATWTVTCRKMETPVPNLQPSSMVTKRSGGQGRQMENRCGSFLHLSAHGLPQGPPSVHPLFSSLPSWLKCIGLLLGAPTASHGSQMDEQMTGWTQNPRGLTHGRCLANAAPPLAPWRGGTRRAGHCYSSPGCSPDGKQKCPGVPWQSGQIPRGARWDRHGAQPPSRCDAHAPCPPPAAPGSHAAAAAAAPAPPAPRPLPARLPALLLALDRGGRTASQNAPPESGAQGPGPGPWGRPPQRAASAEVPREGCRSQEEAAGVWKCQASEEVRQEGRSLTARGLAPLLLTDEEAPVPDPSSCVGSPPAFPGVCFLCSFPGEIAPSPGLL
ncbi:predicted GPI-anchored protein 58 isoform X7 [Prionailurus viverrinus]|uniref:predicted GPI-anchored protein 58 isoform X7 n=1 Tax=Prionailurus viverrinus TaxID=61388 RepID=UPI001FF401F2|nr:predicted GPI-anchored protein 58 isoform X7 [Prionailurus viverrinus]